MGKLFEVAEKATVGTVIVVWGVIWIWFGTPVELWRVFVFILPGIGFVLFGVLKLWVDLSD